MLQSPRIGQLSRLLRAAQARALEVERELCLRLVRRADRVVYTGLCADMSTALGVHLGDEMEASLEISLFCN